MPQLNVLVTILSCILLAGCTGLKRSYHCNHKDVNSINNKEVVIELAIANGCNEVEEVNTISTYDRGGAYEVRCSSMTMKFKCNYTADRVCFWTLNNSEVPFNTVNTDSGYDEPACWRVD